MFDFTPPFQNNERTNLKFQLIFAAGWSDCTSAGREKSAAPSDLVNPWRCAKLHGPQATPQSWVFKPPKQQHELSDIGPLALAADRSMSLCLSEKDKRLRPLSLSLCMSGEP